MVLRQRAEGRGQKLNVLHSIEKRYIAVPEGCWANAIGLQRMAEGRLQRGK